MKNLSLLCPPLADNLRRIKPMAASLAMLVCASPAFIPSVARADGWVPCDASGTPLAYGDPGYGDGYAELINSGSVPTVSLGGTYYYCTDSYLSNYPGTNWYKSAFNSPYADDIDSDFINGFYIATEARNSVFNYGTEIGFFNPANPNISASHTSPNITGEVNTSESGRLVAHFLWTGQPALNPACFLIAGNLRASAVLSYDSTPATGLMDAYAEAALGTDIATVDAGVLNSVPDPIFLSTNRLIMVTPTGNIATISLPASVYANAHNGVDYGEWAGSGSSYYYGKTNGPASSYASAFVTASAIPDNRGVIIGSTTIDTSYHTGPNDPNGVPTKVANTPYPDGSVDADSVAVWDVSHWYGGFPFSGGDTYVATTENFLLPVTFQWTAPGTFTETDDPTNGTSTIHDYVDLGTTNNAFPQISDFSVEATDSDGAVATNGYSVRWHLPYEVYGEPFNIKKTKTIMSTRISGIQHGETGIRGPEPATQIDMSAVIDTLSIVVGEPQDAGLLQIVGAAAGITDWKFDRPGEAGDADISTGATNDGNDGNNLTGNWELANDEEATNDAAYNENPLTDADRNVPDNYEDSPTGWEFCDMSIKVVEFDTKESWHAYGYNDHGYDGTNNHILTADKVDSVHDEPYFTDAGHG